MKLPKAGEIAEAFIDVDSLLYKAGFVTQRTEYDVYICLDDSGKDELMGTFKKKAESDEFIEKHQRKIGAGRRLETRRREVLEPEENALSVLRTIIKGIQNTVKARHYQYFVSASHNFRYDVATLQPYKGNRVDKDKPVHYDALKQFAIDTYGAQLIEDIEADDAISICQWQHMERVLDGTYYEWRDMTCVVSIDKDLMQIPGYHYHPDKVTLEWVGQVQGERFLYAQVMAGDDTDHIPGIKGIGVTTALKKLEGVDSTWKMQDIALEEYRKYARKLEKEGHVWAEYTPEELMLENGNLVYLQRQGGDRFEIHTQGGERTAAPRPKIAFS